MSDLIENVARAICIADGESDPDRMLQLDPPNVAWRFYTNDARAAIAAVAEWLDNSHKLDDDSKVSLALRAAAGSEAKP